MSCPNCYSGSPGMDGGPDGPEEECPECTVRVRLTLDDLRLLRLAISRERRWTWKHGPHDVLLVGLLRRLDKARAAKAAESEE